MRTKSVCKNEILTKEHSKELVLFEQLVQHLSVDLLDFVLDLEDVLRRQPRQDLFVLMQVAVVQHRDLFTDEKGRNNLIINVSLKIHY